MINILNRKISEYSKIKKAKIMKHQQRWHKSLANASAMRIKKKTIIKSFYKGFHCHEQLQSNEDILRNS